MKSCGRLFLLAASTAVVALFFFADSAWAPPECGDYRIAYRVVCHSRTSRGTARTGAGTPR